MYKVQINDWFVAVVILVVVVAAAAAAAVVCFKMTQYICKT